MVHESLEIEGIDDGDGEEYHREEEGRHVCTNTVHNKANSFEQKKSNDEDFIRDEVGGIVKENIDANEFMKDGEDAKEREVYADEGGGRVQGRFHVEHKDDVDSAYKVVEEVGEGELGGEAILKEESEGRERIQPVTIHYMARRRGRRRRRC